MSRLHGARMPFEILHRSVRNRETAEMLLRDGRTDEEVERLTGLDLSAILSMRAGMAASSRRAFFGGASAGRRLWREPS